MAILITQKEEFRTRIIPGVKRPFQHDTIILNRYGPNKISKYMKQKITELKRDIDKSTSWRLQHSSLNI